MTIAEAAALLVKAKGAKRMERLGRVVVLGGKGKPYLLCDQKGMAAIFWTDDLVADDWAVKEA